MKRFNGLKPAPQTNSQNTCFNQTNMKTAFYSHPDFKLHSNGAGHPERPTRLKAIEDALREADLWDKLAHPQFESATEADLQRCHLPAHVARVRQMAEQGGGKLDGDTSVGPQSFEVAKLASGAAIAATRAVIKGECDNAFVAARPPGHHAESGRDAASPWGFCLFDHVAVAARYAQSELGLERVAILDFDVHHGNGTQEIFYADGSVLFVSLHQSPLFPGTGARDETGEGNGEGTTLNFPLPAGCDGDVYRRVWGLVGQRVREFRPDLILLSAGYDAHTKDPLGGMELTAPDYADLVREAKRWAHELCDDRLVAVLEGGYDLGALGQSVVATIEVLKEEPR